MGSERSKEWFRKHIEDERGESITAGVPRLPGECHLHRKDGSFHLDCPGCRAALAEYLSEEYNPFTPMPEGVPGTFGQFAEELY